MGTRDIVPELAHIVEDIPNHVCQFAIVREKFLKTETIKMYLRSTMGQERLSSLALLFIERGLTEAIDLTPVIGVTVLIFQICELIGHF